jgi:hypothetical protein
MLASELDGADYDTIEKSRNQKPSHFPHAAFTGSPCQLGMLDSDNKNGQTPNLTGGIR